MALVATPSLAQSNFFPPTSLPPKIAKEYDEGRLLMRQRKFDKAQKVFERIIKKDSAWVEPHHSLMEIARIFGDASLMLREAKTLANIRPKGPEVPSLRMFIGETLHGQGRYAEAMRQYEMALDTSVRRTPKMDAALRRALSTTTFARTAVQNPIAFKRIPLPPNINRFPLQYNPTVTADGQRLYYTARKGVLDIYDEDIYFSKREADGRWSNPVPLADNINTKGNEGCSSVSADGRTMVFTICNSSGKEPNCDIYIAERQGEGWTNPRIVDSANSARHWDTHATLSADGNRIFFTSSRPGGEGGLDIWTTYRHANGRWSRPANVGPGVNTPDDEATPFLHPNNQTLFFASKGHPGMGNYDLFMAELGADGRFFRPRNLGYPLNTAKDESSIFITPDGEKAYYCVEVIKDNRALSSIMYELELGQALHLKKSYYVKGTVTDAATKKALEAEIELVENATGRRIFRFESDSVQGRYLSILPEGNRYGLRVRRPGYLFQSRFFDFATAAQTGSVTVDFALDKLRPGASTVLNNVFFESARWDLLPESRTELDEVAQMLKGAPKLKVTIEGHTDNVGTPAANVVLSQKRAQSVMAYLVSRGVPAITLLAAGLGETKPVKGNDSEEGRAKNRRIEFRVR